MSAAPPPANDLERLLERAAGGDAAAQRSFQERLPEAELWVVGRVEGRVEDGGDGTAVVGPGARVVLHPARGPGGREFLPAFTSLERLRDAGAEGQPHLALPARVVFQARPPQTSVVLNPGVWHGKELLPEEIADLLAPRPKGEPERVEVPAGRTLYLGEPASYPQALAHALAAFFRQRPTVVEARLGQVHDPVSGLPPHPLVGIGVEGDADLSEALSGVDEVVREHHAGEVDFVGLGEGPGRWLKENAEPFYRRDL